MKKVWKFLSYVLVAALASVVTLTMVAINTPGAKVLLGSGILGGEVSKLDQLEALIEERFIGEADKTAIEDAAATAMIQSLGDRWSYYIPAKDYLAYTQQMANSYVGVGITIQATDPGNGLQVTQVNPNGSAFEAGILAGDVLVAVNGKNVRGLDVNATADLVRGDAGTFVDLTVERNGKEMTFHVERRELKVDVAKARMLDGEIGLVTIANFDSRCAEETIAAIESLLNQGAKSLVFDVRNNPGGYVDELVKVLDYLLPEGELFRSVDYTGREDVKSSDASCLEGVPMAVLVNGNSYSAAEFFAAALSEYEAAVVVGQPTVGKGYFQVTYQLKDGSAVGLSIGKYFTPKGVSLAEVGGLTPDLVVEVDEAAFAAIYAGTLEPAQDPQIQAAVEALTK